MANKSKPDKPWILRISACKIHIAEFWLAPLAFLFARYVVARDFWSSGVLKLPHGFLGIGEGDWETTVYAFETEYPVPLLSPEMAAYLSTSIEIIAPVLLVIGLGSRVAALAVLGVVGMIEFTYQGALQHSYWIALSLIILLQGPGKLSLDHLIRRKFLKGCEYCGE